MIHIHKLLILFFIIHSSIFAQNWNEAVNAVSKRLVLIEYYEQLNSMESMEDKEKIKKHLTGILVSADGLILTSSSIFKASLEFNTFSYLYNPFQKPVQIRVKINGSGYLPAEFIGKDDDVHLAFIKLKTQPDISPVLFKHRDPLQLGERVLILQHLTKAYDYNLLVNERLINAIVDKPQTKYLCEPTLNSLSDFGLTLNGQGQPVGLYISPLNEGRSMLDFHDMSENEPKEILPAESFRKLIENPPVFREKNPSRKKWLGIYMQPYPEKMAAYFGNGNIKGILVNTVIEDSPADRAGIKVGDVITDIDGKSLRAETDNDLNMLRKIIREHDEDLIRFTIFRKGKSLVLKGGLSETPISQFLANEATNTTLGFSVKELTQDFIIAKQLDFDTDGVWVSKIEQAGWADLAGLRRGDLLLKINEKKISTLNDAQTCFRSIHESKPGYISLFIKRHSETQFLFLKTNY